ncbi:MAG: hypothetical protein IPG12_03195 [Saprospiraceae bacterium]|nr:hypothetical protein [Saprospiraceae bacterium]
MFLNILYLIVGSKVDHAPENIYPFENQIEYYDLTEAFVYLALPLVFLFIYKQYHTEIKNLRPFKITAIELKPFKDFVNRSLLKIRNIHIKLLKFIVIFAGIIISLIFIIKYLDNIRQEYLLKQKTEHEENILYQRIKEAKKTKSDFEIKSISSVKWNRLEIETKYESYKMTFHLSIKFDTF